MWDWVVQQTPCVLTPGWHYVYLMDYWDDVQQMFYWMCWLQDYWEAFGFLFSLVHSALTAGQVVELKNTETIIYEYHLSLVYNTFFQTIDFVNTGAIFLF